MQIWINCWKQQKKCGIRVVLDLVVNHCSDEHIWFQKAKEDPHCEESGYFYFTRTANGKEPNNWRSNFGGSVWSQLPDGRWYYHTFSPKQPDLNWENPKLRQKIYDMINWWLEKGVSGFRVDAITFIKKDITFQSKPTDDGSRYPVEKLVDYPGIGTYLTEMREKTFQPHNCMTVAEAPGVTQKAFRRYTGENGYFSMILDFEWDDMEDETDKSSIGAAERWKKKLLDSQSFVSQNGWSGVFLENHDQSRCVNKFLEEKNRNFASASALATLYFFLHGTPIIYQGQEIGMTNAVWHNIEEMQDVRAKRTYQEALDQQKDANAVFRYFSEWGRDNARTPMQWSAGTNAGFTSGTPWMIIQNNYVCLNVMKQEKNPNSLLSYYKKLTRLRRSAAYKDVFAEGNFSPLLREIPGVIAYERTLKSQSIFVVVNFTDRSIKIPLQAETCLINNGNQPLTKGPNMQLEPYQAVVLSKKSEI